MARVKVSDINTYVKARQRYNYRQKGRRKRVGERGQGRKRE